MNLFDNVEKNSSGAVLPELHGHTKITLTDVETGKEEVIEEDNIVTNAVRDLLKRDYYSLINASKILPIRNMYAGVACFASALDEDADKYEFPSEATAALTAYAGDEAHSTGNTLRGNPNNAESGQTADGRGYKFVWDFSTSQGNGTIASVCLTNKWLGNYGKIPYEGETVHPFNLNMLCGSDLAYVSIHTNNRDDCIKCPPIYDPETGEGIAFYYSTGNLEIINIYHTPWNFGLNNALNEFKEESSVNVAITSSKWYAGYMDFAYDETNFYFYGVSTTKTSNKYRTLTIITINRSTNAVSYSDTLYSFENPNTEFLRSNDQSYVHDEHSISPSIGSVAYLPLTVSALGDSGDFFAKIDLSDPEDIIGFVSGTGLTDKIFIALDMVEPVRISDGLIVGSGYIIDGDTVYPIPNFTSFRGTGSGTSSAYARTILKKGYLYGITSSSSPNYNRAQKGPILNPYFLSTINVLQSPVTKTASQTMKIEYTITEA